MAASVGWTTLLMTSTGSTHSCIGQSVPSLLHPFPSCLWRLCQLHPSLLKQRFQPQLCQPWLSSHSLQWVTSLYLTLWSTNLLQSWLSNQYLKWPCRTCLRPPIDILQPWLLNLYLKWPCSPFHRLWRTPLSLQCSTSPCQWPSRCYRQWLWLLPWLSRPVPTLPSRRSSPSTSTEMLETDLDHAMQIGSTVTELFV